MNYWNTHMGDDEGAATYMLSYNEGPGSPLRHLLGSLINDGESVLDVGCGPGWNYDHFREFGPSVPYKGYDYSDRFVRVANKRVNEKYEIPDVHQMVFWVGDVRNIYEPRDGWDVVIMQDVLEHTNGYEKPLEEALRVAKKRIIITFWRLSDGDTDQINDDGDDGYGAAYSRSKWEAYLDSLDLHWLHDEVPRKANKHDVYIIDLKENHG